MIGSIRRQCLDHVVVLSQRHLRKLLKSYFAYYHRFGDAPGIGKGRSRIESDHEAVSYTHLDVYKRQLRNRANETVEQGKKVVARQTRAVAAAAAAAQDTYARESQTETS